MMRNMVASPRLTLPCSRYSTMTRPRVVASPAAARMRPASPRLAPGSSATSAITIGVDQRGERCPGPDLVVGAGGGPGQLLRGNRDGDEQQPDERARYGGAAAEEVVEADRDHRLKVPGGIAAHAGALATAHAHVPFGVWWLDAGLAREPALGLLVPRRRLAGHGGPLARGRTPGGAQPVDDHRQVALAQLCGTLGVA